MTTTKHDTWKPFHYFSSVTDRVHRQWNCYVDETFQNQKFIMSINSLRKGHKIWSDSMHNRNSFLISSAQYIVNPSLCITAMVKKKRNVSLLMVGRPMKMNLGITRYTHFQHNLNWSDHHLYSSNIKVHVKYSYLWTRWML